MYQCGTEEYQQIEFVVGDVSVYHNRFVLHDLAFLNNTNSDNFSGQEASEDFDLKIGFGFRRQLRQRI